MLQPVRIALVVIAGLIGGFQLARPESGPADASGLGLAGAALPAAEVAAVRSQPLRFHAATSAGNRRVVLDAIAAARPEARALIDAVDGLVEVSVAPSSGEGVGYTRSRGNDDFKIVVDLDRVYAESGLRGIRRMVLHEFGHVIDGALVDGELEASLDAGIPRGVQCEPGQPTGACATRAERFAESFAKWAMNDIGVDIYIGYAVPPPALPLADWGRPLAALAAR